MRGFFQPSGKIQVVVYLLAFFYFYSVVCLNSKIQIHYLSITSFWITVLAHWAGTHFGRPSCLIQVGCVLTLVAVGRGHLTWIPGNRHLCHTHCDRRSLSRREPSLQALNLSGGARFIARCLRRHLLGEMPTELKTFLYFWTYGSYVSAFGSHNKKRPYAKLVRMFVSQRIVVVFNCYILVLGRAVKIRNAPV